MLTNSDNDIAEALNRQTAIATGRPASFDGGAEAVPAQLAKLQLPLGGAVFADGSGLNRADKVTAGLLTQLLARAADPARPELRPILTGLPVAAFTGTLSTRYGHAHGSALTLVGGGDPTLDRARLGRPGRRHGPRPERPLPRPRTARRTTPPCSPGTRCTRSDRTRTSRRSSPS